MKSFVNKKIFIESNEYTYRVEHLTLEGTCSTDHGPRNVKIKNLLVPANLVTQYFNGPPKKLLLNYI